MKRKIDNSFLHIVFFNPFEHYINKYMSYFLYVDSSPNKFLSNLKKQKNEEKRFTIDFDQFFNAGFYL